MIKKMFTFIVGLSGLFIALIAFVVLPSIAGYLATYYPREAVVTSINKDSEEITVIDTTNNEWSFYGTGYTKGGTVKMKMFTNYTDSNIYDDKIVDVKIIKENLDKR